MIVARMIRSPGYACRVARSSPIALLRHDLPDGTSHVDLLIGAWDRPAGDEDRTVPCWRCPQRPDRSEGAFAALRIERIGDHRGLYLRLQAPRDLGGGRGTVTPLRAGTGTSDRSPQEGGRIAVTWSDGGQSHWSLEPTRGPEWTLRPLAAEIDGPIPNPAPASPRSTP